MTQVGPGAFGRRKRDWLGQTGTWITTGALALNLILIAGLLGLIASHGLTYFWQGELDRVVLDDGSIVLGEILDREEIPEAEVTESGAAATRIRLKVGNRDFTGVDFRWVDEARIVERERPGNAVLLERLEWGNFYGWLVELRRGDQVLASGSDAVWAALPSLHRAKRQEFAALRELERDDVGDINSEIERLRLAERRLELSAPPSPERDAELAQLRARALPLQAEYEELARELSERREALEAEVLVLEAGDGSRRELAVGHVVRAIRPNELGFLGKLQLYISRTAEFLLDEPRESNTEGGIFPAIFGTVLMVFLMSFAVAPFGVLAAVYLQEYARQGAFVRLVRIAVNNLAGVPSIVFGVFGLGFFVYLVGGSIDSLFFPESLPTPTYGTGGILWASLTLALLTVPVVIVASEEGLAAVPRNVREGSRAVGATQFETLWRVVIPAAAPGIMTGLILAIARAAGEVAPLMIVGMVKLAPSLPLDGTFPFLHPERKFMHLGFHIYDVGFQSPNVEAAKPLVFATAFLLISVVLTLNLVAILVRNRLRSRYATSSV
jgi:phosphate transport system permease protein